MSAGRNGHYRACYFDLVDNVFRGLLRWLRYACVAGAQARRELPDVLALPIQTPDHNVRPCPPAILNGSKASKKIGLRGECKYDSDRERGRARPVTSSTRTEITAAVVDRRRTLARGSSFFGSVPGRAFEKMSRRRWCSYLGAACGHRLLGITGQSSFSLVVVVMVVHRGLARECSSTFPSPLGSYGHPDL
jgi:hypothetical protein